MSTSLNKPSNKMSWYKSMCAKIDRVNKLAEKAAKSKATPKHKKASKKKVTTEVVTK